MHRFTDDKLGFADIVVEEDGACDAQREGQDDAVSLLPCRLKDGPKHGEVIGVPVRWTGTLMRKEDWVADADASQLGSRSGVHD